MEKIVFECKVKRKEKEALIKIFNWCIKQLRNVNRSDKGANNIAKINALEDKITEIVEVLPKLKYMKKEHYDGFNLVHVDIIAELAAGNRMYKLLKECCTPPQTTLITGYHGFTMLEHLAIHMDWSYAKSHEDKQKIVDIILNAIQDDKVLFHKGLNGQNFGMFCINHLDRNTELKSVVELFITNPETATMQDANGNNIGMLCAICNQQELFELAYKNPVARLQRNNKGETMALIANNNGLLVPPLTEQELYEEYSNIYEEQIKNLCK